MGENGFGQLGHYGSCRLRVNKKGFELAKVIEIRASAMRK
jgi:hypothetical protein